MRNKLSTLFILCITIVLLFLVVRKVGLAELIQTLKGAELFWAFLSLALSPVLILSGAAKWQVLLRSKGIDIPLPRLFGYYLVGRFFNYFLPSNVGGDVVRGYELGNYIKNGTEAMASVFMERFTGLVMLVVFAMVSTITNFKLIMETGLAPALVLVLVALLGVIWLILDRRPLELAAKFAIFPLTRRIFIKLKEFHASIYAYRNQWRTLAIALIWSMVFMGLAIANVYITSMAFHRAISLDKISVIVPIILVVSMFPLTINGLGVQEWAYVFMFTWVGMPAAVGLSTILFIRGKDILLALIGGILYPILKLGKKDEYARS